MWLAFDYRDGADSGPSPERFAALVAAAELEALVGEWAEKVEPVCFWSIKNPKTITRAELIAKATGEQA